MLSNKPSLGFHSVLRFNVLAIAFLLMSSLAAFATTYDISGVIYNENSTSGIPGNYINHAKVCIFASTDTTHSTELACDYSSSGTSNSGTYNIYGVAAGVYDLCVKKDRNEDVNGYITSADATRIIAHTTGSNLFTTDALKWAADTSGNGTISSFDATQVTNWISNNANGAHTGEWRFWPEGTAVPWPTHDASVCFSYDTSVVDDQVDFDGILKGEVTGDWVQ